jgi:hypothetical protein
MKKTKKARERKRKGRVSAVEHHSIQGFSFSAFQVFLPVGVCSSL